MRKRKVDPVPVIGHRLESGSEPLRKNQSSASSDICPTPRRSLKLRDVGRSVLNPGTIVLNSVTDYLYREAQECRTSEERDSFSLALAICAAVRTGDPKPLSSASYMAFGSTLDRYLKHRSYEQWMRHQELMRCIPDYDPEAKSMLDSFRYQLHSIEEGWFGDIRFLTESEAEDLNKLRPTWSSVKWKKMGGANANVEPKSEERGQQARPRNLYEMPPRPKPAQPELVPRLPRKSAAD